MISEERIYKEMILLAKLQEKRWGTSKSRAINYAIVCYLFWILEDPLARVKSPPRNCIFKSDDVLDDLSFSELCNVLEDIPCQ